MKIEFRPITAAVIAVVLVSAAVADGARSRRLDEDAALALFERTLKHGPVYNKRISWDVSRSAPKRPPMLILIVWSAQFTTRNAAEHRKRVLLSTATVFTAVRANSRSGKRLRTNGRLTTAPRSSSDVSDPFRTQVAPAEASALMF